MLKHRLLFGALLIAVIAALLYLDDRFAGPLQLGPRMIRHEGLLVAFVLSILVLIGTIEMCRLAEAAGHAPLLALAAFSNYLLVLAPYFTHNGLIAGITSASDLTLAVLIIAFLGTCTLVAARGKTDRAISDIAVTMLVILYAGLLPSFLLRLRLSGGSAGVPLLVYFLAVTKSCDIGAYFTGRAIGRHKLIEWLSPKKTVEGLFGGIALSVAVAIGLSRWPSLRIWTDGVEVGPIPISIAAAFGVAMAVIGQGGDLLESLFKRDAQVKDSSQILPGFGGVLDLIDSLLPTAPVACLMLLQ